MSHPTSTSICLGSKGELSTLYQGKHLNVCEEIYHLIMFYQPDFYIDDVYCPFLRK